MNPKAKTYFWSALAAVLTYVLLAIELYRELHPLTNKGYLTVFLFPLGPAVLVSTAINLKLMKPKFKKYNQRMILGLVAYILGIDLLHHISLPAAPYKYLLVLLPILPLIYICFTIIRVVADLDEMWQKIHLEAMAFSGIATGFTCISYDFLYDVGAPKLSLEAGFFLMWIYYFIGLFFSRRRCR
ncbi:MAG TPA: hypothetical protein VGO57_08070 [Verrucomicrobiae bacterium]